MYFSMTSLVVATNRERSLLTRVRYPQKTFLRCLKTYFPPCRSWITQKIRRLTRPILEFCGSWQFAVFCFSTLTFILCILIITHLICISVEESCVENYGKTSLFKITDLETSTTLSPPLKWVQKKSWYKKNLALVNI